MKEPLAFKHNETHNHSLTHSYTNSLTHPGFDVWLMLEPVSNVLYVRGAPLRDLVNLILGPLHKLRAQRAHILPAHDG